MGCDIEGTRLTIPVLMPGLTHVPWLGCLMSGGSSWKLLYSMWQCVHDDSVWYRSPFCSTKTHLSGKQLQRVNVASQCIS